MLGISIDPNNPQHEILYKLLTKLSPREQSIIIYRYGLFGQERLSLRLCAPLLSLSNERIRQLEREALVRLRKEDVRSLVQKLTHLDLLKAIMGECDCGCLYTADTKLWCLGKIVVCDKCYSEAKNAA